MSVLRKTEDFITENFSAFRKSSALTKLIILLASIVGAMSVGSLLLLAVGADPLDAYFYMHINPISSLSSIGEISMYFTPLLLVGLGVCFTFHAKLNNLGGEGQMLFGAVGMTLMGISPVSDVLGIWSLPAGILLGMIFGALWASIAGFFRVFFHASEIVVTLMLNYIAKQIVSYILFYHLRSSAEPQSAKIAYAMPRISAGSRINWGVVIALLLVFVYAVVIRRTGFGYHLRTLGGSEKAAVYSGADKKKLFFSAMLISGAFCGLAGAMQINGNTMRLMEGVAGDFGFSGIVVAMLGSLTPYGVAIAALFMAVLQAGSVTMQVRTGIPTSFASVLQALMVLFILLGMALNTMHAKKSKKGGKA